MKTANAGLASLPFVVAGTRGYASITVLVVRRYANAGASLGFGNVSGRHFGGNLVPPFSGTFSAVC